MLVIGVLIVIQNVNAQHTEIISSIDTLLQFGHFPNSAVVTKTEKNAESMKLYTTFKEDLKILKTFLREDEKNQFGGKISFGLNSLESESSNFFVINTNIALSKSRYPFKFDLNSGLLAQIQNGAIDETVSNLFIAFDYNFSEKDVGKESYVFLNATNNSFLEVDQRYELGGGLILNHYSGKNSIKKKYGSNQTLNREQLSGLTKKGVEKLMGDEDGQVLSERSFDAQVDEVGSPSDNKREKRKLKASRKRFTNIIIKNYSTTRWSVLAGINYELEQTRDSMTLFNGDLIRKGAFDATNRFRMVIRPGFQYKGNAFSFSSKLFIKMGIFGELTNEVSEGSLSDSKADYWVDWTSSLRFNFTDKIGLVISYNFFYDNAPNRLFFNTAALGEPEFRVFEAEKYFRAFTFSFSYKL